MTTLFDAIAAEALSDVQRLAKTADHTLRNENDLTPFLLAVDMGNIPMAEVLLPHTKPEGTVRDIYQPESALVIAILKNRIEMLNWLIEQGFVVEAYDETLAMAVHQAETIDTKAATILVREGLSPDVFSDRILRRLTGAELMPEQNIAPEIFDAEKHRVFGTKNPELVTHKFWYDVVRRFSSGFKERKRFNVPHSQKPAIWSFSRDGRTTTQMPDGRWIQVGGEYEDWYDPDFCIYNDVVVHDGRGKAQIYSYPRDVFPPTDFHTATIVNDQIILIGNLGYGLD